MISTSGFREQSTSGLDDFNFRFARTAHFRFGVENGSRKYDIPEADFETDDKIDVIHNIFPVNIEIRYK